MAWAGYPDHGSMYGSSAGMPQANMMGGLVPKAPSTQAAGSTGLQRTSWSAPVGFMLGGAPPAPAPPPPQAPPNRFSLQEYKRRLQQIYAVHNPQKLGTLDYLLFDKYKGKEDLLYESVCTKYSIDPEGFASTFGAPEGSPEATVPKPPTSSPKQTSGSKQQVQEWDPAKGEMVDSSIDLDKMMLEAFGSDIPEGLQESVLQQQQQQQQQQQKHEKQHKQQKRQQQLPQQQSAPSLTAPRREAPVAQPPEDLARLEMEKRRRMSEQADAAMPDQEDGQDGEDDDEDEEEEDYDPFGTSPDDGKRKFQAKVPQLVDLDTWLLGEKSGFFEATLGLSGEDDHEPPGKQAKVQQQQHQEEAAGKTSASSLRTLLVARLQQPQQQAGKGPTSLNAAPAKQEVDLAAVSSAAAAAMQAASPGAEVDDGEEGSSSSSSSGSSDSEDGADDSVATAPGEATATLGGVGNGTGTGTGISTGTGPATAAATAATAAAVAAQLLASAKQQGVGGAGDAGSAAASEPASAVAAPDAAEAQEEAEDGDGDVAMEDAYGYLYDEDEEVVDDDALRAALEAAAASRS